MKLSKFRVVLVGLLALLVVGALGIYIFRAPIKSAVNEIRAERIFNRAQEAFVAERWVEAARLGIAAHHLDRENTDNRVHPLLIALIKYECLYPNCHNTKFNATHQNLN